MIINLQGDLYRVTYTMHVTPGKGVACMQTKLKNIMTGKNLENRFRSDEKVEKADLETHSMQYLFAEPTGLVFMNNETFEQVTLAKDLVGEAEKYLKEGTAYQVTFYEENAVGLDLPNTIDLKVTSAPPEIRKATASSSLRPVEVENGMTILAPAFIKEGDLIRVNTETGEYLGRV
jgi:elongation factor P